MTPIWASANSWKVSYKNKGVCYIKTGQGFWRVLFHRYQVKEYETFLSADTLSESTWANVNDCIKFCTGCSFGCAPGMKKKINSKNYDNVCFNMPVIFYNPDIMALNNVKKLIEFRKNVINDNAGK